MSDQLIVTVQRPSLTIGLGSVPVNTGSGVSDGDKGDIVVSSGGSVWSIDSAVLSAFGRTLVDDADAAAARATLGLQNQWTVLKLGSDFVESAGTLTDVGLGFTPAAGKQYDIELVLVWTTAAITTGLQYCLTAPASLGTGTTWAWQALQVPSSINAQVLRFAQMGTVVAGTGATSTTEKYPAIGRGGLKIGTGPSGDCKVQAQTEVASSAITILAGSVLRYREV